jgi:PAS domain S-box-containing protein
MNYQAIIPSLRQWLTPPVFADKEQSRAARWLNFLILIFIALITVDSAAILIGLLDQSALTQVLATNGAALIANLVALLTMRRGYIRSAAITLLTILYVLITYLNAIIFQTIHTFNVIAYFVLIPLVGLLLGRRSMNMFAALCMVTISAIFYLEWSGILIPTYSRSIFDNIVILFFAILLNTVLLNASIRRAEEQANEVRQSASALALANQELQQSQVHLQQARTELESKVQQRTQELKDSNEKLQKEVEERQRLLTALVSSEANWRSLAEQVPDIIARINLDQTIAFINRAFDNHMPDKLIGMPVTLIHQQSKHQQLLRDSIRTVLQTGETESYEIEVTVEERRTWQINRLGPIWQEGKIAALILIATDITEQKQTAAAMYQMQKLESLGILAGGVAHDFNNLLSVMLMQLSLGMKKLPDDHPVQYNLDRTLKAAERATELTRQMLNYAGRLPAETKQFNLNELILDNIHLFSASISKNIKLTAELSNDAPLMLGDRGQLQQLIMNLIINSADAIGGKTGMIRVVTTLKEASKEIINPNEWIGTSITTGCYVQLEVHDTGCGMDAQTLKKIFDPFFTTKFTGRGLGLASVIGIVRAHKGSLHVTSVVDKGTTFNIRFPTAVQETPSTDQTTVMHFAGANEMIRV